MNPFRQRWRRWFARRFLPTRGPVTVSAKRVYILPTAGGWAFLAMLGALWLFAINYSNNLIYLLLFWLAGLGLLALVHTHRQLVGLSFEVLPLMPQFADEPLHLRVRVVNPGKKVARGLMVGPAWAQKADSPEQPIINNVPGNEPGNVLDVNQRATLTYSPMLPGRGIYVAPLLRLSTTYPLGLYRAWTFLHQPVEGLRYPQRQTEADLPARQLAQNDVSNGAATTEGSDEFDGLRRYRSGDSPRHIAWRTVAKQGGLRAMPNADHKSLADSGANSTVDSVAQPASQSTVELAELQTRRFIATGQQQLHLDIRAARAAVVQANDQSSVRSNGQSDSTRNDQNDAAAEHGLHAVDGTVDELALSLLCAQVLIAREQGLSFRLTSGDKAAAGAAARHKDSVLAELALYGQVSESERELEPELGREWQASDEQPVSSKPNRQQAAAI